MASIDFGSFFGTSSSSGMGNMLSDYASIKNGSYGKLLKATYAKNSSSANSSGSTAKTNNVLDKILEEKKNPTVSKETQEANSALSSNLSSLKTSLGALQKDSTFEDGTDGTTAKDKVASAVKSYVENYNNTVKSAKESTLAGATSNVASMMKATSANADKLKELGINVQSDGTLLLDEKKLKEADVNAVHEVFDANEVTSYGSTVGSRIRFAGYSTGATTGSTSTDSVSTKKETSESALSVKNDALALGSDDLYKKLLDEDGNETAYFDIDSIAAKAKDFVSNFNDMLNAAKFSTNSGVASNLSYIKSRTEDNADKLSQFGISVNSNGSLGFNESVFKSADMNEVQDFFKNYGSGVATNASLINFYMNSQASASSGYTSDASYNVQNTDPTYSTAL